MAGVNKCILIGHLGADPEIRNLPSGSSVANFNIATSESYTNKNGERVTQTEWHRIECWDGLAKIAEQYLKKGNQVYIEGKLRTEEWQDQQGNTRYTTKIRANSMTMLGGAPSQGQQNSQSNNQAQPQGQPALSGEPVEDDLPF
jgi:single-strand DNA-binding protein